MSDEDNVPISVRLGEVVPPEDPEDWTRPLTWIAALGMLAGPAVALGWFVVAPPTDASSAHPATYAVAVAIAAGAALTGATQLGVTRAWTATVGAGLFASLATIILGLVMSGERQVGSASPQLAHATAAAAAGVIGSVVAALVVVVSGSRRPRLARLGPAMAAGAVAAVASVSAIFRL